MINKSIKVIFYVCAVLLIKGCEEASYSEEELKKYMADPANGVTIEKEVNGTRITLSYRPIDLSIAQELSGNKNVNKKTIDSLREYYKEKIYFIVSFSKDNQEVENQYLYDKNTYNQVLQHLNYGISEDFKLVSAMDTIPLFSHIYPRMYSTTGKSSLMLIFKETGKLKGNGINVLYNDSYLGLGRHVFSFKQEDIKKIPSLKFD